MTTQEDGQERSSDEAVEQTQELTASWPGYVEVPPRPDITDTEAGRKVLELIRADRATQAAGRRSVGAMLRRRIN